MKIKFNRFAIVAIFIVASLVACGDKDNDNSDNPDTISGSTRPNEEEPDTISGSTRPADGTIVKGRIGTGTFTLNGQTEQNAYGIDFNKDGVLEYRIVYEGEGLSYEAASNNVVISSGLIATLAKHTSINASSNFAGNGNSSLPAVSSLPEKFYVGCRFTLSDGVHYGWVKVKYDDGELEWDKCAYNTTSSASLTAGDD